MSKVVDIEIKDSVVYGDVVAGDKNIVVHLHESQLSSVAAIHAALLQQGNEAAAADRLIQTILANPDLAKLYEERKVVHDRAHVDQLVDATIRDHQRAGTSPEMIEKLWTAVRTARKVEDWVSFSKSGTVLLQLTHNDANAGEDLFQLAGELVAVGRKDEKFSVNIPIGRIYQAKHLFQQHFKAVLDLRTGISAAKALPRPISVANLQDELRHAIGFAALSDEYARQALDLAFKCSDPPIGIYVLFAFVTLQNHQHFLYHLLIGADGYEIADRIRRTSRLLQQLTDKFGTPHDVAMMYSNTSAFWLQTGEYEKAETLATSAAERFSSLGDAHGAARALKIAASARKREQVLRPPPTDADVEAASIDDIIAGIRSGVESVGRLNGIDVNDPMIRDAVEIALRDFTPERVLRYCDHITADCAPSPLGLTLSIPSLGIKTISCLQFRRRISGGDLDRAFVLFKERLGCESCVHRSPRATDWKWSMRWAAEDALKRRDSRDPPVGSGYY